MVSQMNKIFKSPLLASIGTMTALSAQAELDSNRYGYPALYKSEISSAEAWERANNQPAKGKLKPVILDVRRVEEYVKGHPPGAISIPFPHVHKSPIKDNDGAAYYTFENGKSLYIGYDISEDPEDVGFQTAPDYRDGVIPIADFIAEVEAKFPDKKTPLYLVCATGFRSVQAGNALAKAGYTEVRNVWEGWNGLPKYAYTRTGFPEYTLDAEGKPVFTKLDVNHDGKIDVNDNDGWAFYQGLPVETKFKKKLVDQRFLDLYEEELNKLK